MYKDTEPVSTADMTKRAMRILDAKYEAADLPKVVNECDHLGAVEKEKLLSLLQDYKDLFDGTLGNWKTQPVHFELKEGAKPFHWQPFPVPLILRETLKKRLNVW